MMNVGIIFYAAQQTKDASLLQVASQHCLTTRRYLVRGDASTSHEGLFDTETGEFLRQTTHQGWRNDSSWARGQTWALYGFTTAYQFTQDARFLDTAQRCADFYIERTPAMGCLLTTGKSPTRQKYESSAAAVAAAGLLELAKATEHAAKADRYREYAFTSTTPCSNRSFLPTKRQVGKASSSTASTTNGKSSASMRASCGANIFYPR